MLFKYMKGRHAENFLRHGTLRIGTLYEYRDTEKHGAVIGDAHEGTKSLYTEVKGRHTKKTAPPIVGKFLELGENSTIEDCVFVNQMDSPDCYIFCGTEEYSSAVMAEFDATVCLAIEDVRGFYGVLSKSLIRATGNAAFFRGAYRCSYIDRNVKHDEDHGLPGALIKEPKYSNQKEIRAIWEPAVPQAVSPIIISCPEARQFCTIYPKPMGTT